MKQFIKLTIFLQLLVVFVYGCVWITLKLINQDCPLMALPIIMLMTLAAEILSIFIEPIAEKWLE